MKYLDLCRVERSRLPLKVWLEIITGLYVELGASLDTPIFKLGFEHPLLPEFPFCTRLDVIPVPADNIHKIAYKGGRIHTAVNRQSKLLGATKVIGYGEPHWRAVYAGLSPLDPEKLKSDPLDFHPSGDNWYQDGNFRIREDSVVVSIPHESPTSGIILWCGSTRYSKV